MGAKAKISVTVDRELLQEADRLAEGMTRSQLFEHALAGWVRHRGRAQLDEAIARYYASLTAAERGEDHDWASLGDDAAARSWDR
jgi:metal-responsive CopG/Arc/MetJ family transcriptional regulator